MMRYLMNICYKGTHYAGWQRQKNAVSVQEVLENSLSTLLKTPILTMGSSRTDKGVHCRGQFVHFETVILFRSVKYIQYKLNQILPEDIAVQSILLVPLAVHARFSAFSRVYQYHIHFKKNPFLRETSLYIKTPLDIGEMNRACVFLKTQNYFASFVKTNTNNDNYYCEIKEVFFQEKDDTLLFHIEANRFLRGMVRILVQELLFIGKGEKSLESFKNLFINIRPKNLLKLVPPEGLTLWEVKLKTKINHI